MSIEKNEITKPKTTKKRTHTIITNTKIIPNHDHT